MKKVVSESSGKTYLFYDSAKELPIKRWHQFVTKSIMNSTIGASFESCIQKLAQMDTLLNKGDREGFVNARTNLQYDLYSLYKGTSLVSEALVELLHSVDGVPVDQSDPEKVNLVLNDDVFTLELVTSIYEDVRKK